MAVVLIIGPFFAGHLRPSETTQGRASMLANMRYHTAVIISLFTALGSLASSSRKLMRLGAHAERILELENTAKEINAGEDCITAIRTIPRARSLCWSKMITLLGNMQYHSMVIIS